ncbi:GNAT family N-acetyltransferase [Henriciella aquimarina]|uniref:GNAT family N-acetyltransferase n=1 Tax=Henriciella aquimarina TaxID=545261 RepID=UPI0009FCF81C|nr:GNAT family N-acetyltransferase [Henriciella aquimarina]
MTELRTRRLYLRPLRLEDAPRVTELVNEPGIYERVARIKPGQSKEETGRWILSVERGHDLGTDHVFAIMEGDTLIGTIGAHRLSADRPYEIGYWIAPEAWGKGIATEAAQAVIEWLEAIGAADEIVSGYFADNPASGRVLEKLGFEATHEAPVYCAGRGKDIDHVFMVRKAAKE